MIKLISKRNHAGNYTVSVDGDKTGRTVLVHSVEYDDGIHWMAVAEWISNVYSDPVDTKHHAMEVAKQILTEWDEFGRWKEIDTGFMKVETK